MENSLKVFKSEIGCLRGLFILFLNKQYKEMEVQCFMVLISSLKGEIGLIFIKGSCYR